MTETLVRPVPVQIGEVLTAKVGPRSVANPLSEIEYQIQGFTRCEDEEGKTVDCVRMAEFPQLLREITVPRSVVEGRQRFNLLYFGNGWDHVPPKRW